MSCEVKYIKSLDCVEYIFTGANSGQDIKNATSQGIATGREYGTLNYLVDLTQLEFIGSIVPLLDLSAKQYEAENLIRRSKIAIVLPISQKNKAGRPLLRSLSFKSWLERAKFQLSIRRPRLVAFQKCKEYQNDTHLECG